MAVEKGLCRLRRIGLDEAGVRLRQVETKHMQLHAHAADDADAFAEIDLRVAGRMGERDENLARSGAGDPHVILHHRVGSIRSRSKIRFAVCRCLGAAALSASRIASMTGMSGPSFGRSGAFERAYAGGS